MTHALVNTFINRPLPQDPVRRQQARLALMLLYVLTSLSVIIMAVQFGQLLAGNVITDDEAFMLLQNALVLAGAIIGIGLIWQGRSDAAIWLIMATLMLMGIRSMATFGASDTPTVLTFLLSIIFALLLMKRRTLYGVLVMVLAMLLAGLVVAENTLSREVGAFFALLALLTIVIDQITSGYRHMIDQLRLNTLELESNNHALQKEIKRRERAEKIEARLTRLLENTSDYVMIVDNRAKPLYVNGAGRALAGIEADSTLNGLPATFFFPQWALDLVGKPPDQHFKQGIYMGEATIAPIAGVEVPVSQVIIAHLDEQGRVDQLSSVCRDLLDRQFAEKAQLNITLQSERNKALQQMVSRFTHDLRTPLGAIVMSLYLAERQPDDADGRQRRFNNIREQAKLLQDLIQDTLIYSQLKVHSPIQGQPIYLMPLFEQMKRDKHQVAADAGVRLTIELPHEDLWVMGDATMLRRLIDQLVDNGIKYTPAGGRVGVRLFAEDGQVIISVMDTGIGIEDDELPHIFEQFYRAANAKDMSLGTGVGLAIVREILQLHGGEVVVNSTVGQGSTFTIKLRGSQSPMQH